jgi:threonine synthase
MGEGNTTLLRSARLGPGLGVDRLLFKLENLNPTDEEIWDAQRQLVCEEGVYAEPAREAALAGLKRALGLGLVSRSESSVCLVTGNGFKDPAAVETMNKGSVVRMLQIIEIDALKLA